MGDSKEDKARDKARADLANAYDDFDMKVEQHWTEKASPLLSCYMTLLAQLLRPSPLGMLRRVSLAMLTAYVCAWAQQYMTNRQAIPACTCMHMLLKHKMSQMQWS